MRIPSPVLLVLVGALACGGPASVEPVPERLPWSGTALSLRVLQQRLAACMPRDDCPAELLHLGGLTRLEGVVKGDDDSDWILIGQQEAGQPPLWTEDLVVALRNTWLQYARRQGNTLYYANPGCSIDPSPKVFDALQHVSIGGDEGAGIALWRTTCARPQAVRVLGIPFDTHFAAVMVRADYLAKNLVDGSASVPGLTSLSDRTLNILKKELEKGSPSSQSSSLLNRFEFVPGETAFLGDNDTALIQACPVTLMTEEEYLTGTGSISGTGHADPLAKEFATEFTAEYSKIAAVQPIYLELEGLFRTVAVARLLKLHTEGQGLTYLLDEYRVLETEVERSLPGISNVKTYTYRREHSGGWREAHIWLPSCGGVNIDIEVKLEDLKPVSGGQLTAIRDALRRDRPSRDVLGWGYDARR